MFQRHKIVFDTNFTLPLIHMARKYNWYITRSQTVLPLRPAVSGLRNNGLESYACVFGHPKETWTETRN